MKLLFRVGLSAGFSLALLALMLHLFGSGLSLENRPSILNVLSDTTHSLLFVYAFLYLIQLCFRAWRYQALIAASGETNIPSFFHMSVVTGVRNMLVDMLPARVGELSYVAMLNRAYKVSVQACLSSLTVAIAFDFVALLFVVLGLLSVQLFSGGVEGWMYGVAISAAVISFIAVAGLFVVAPWFVSVFGGKTQNNKILKVLFLFAEKIVTALNQTRQAGVFVKVLLLSVTIRVLKYTGFYLLFRAVVVPSFDALSSLPMPEVVSALIGGELAASLPVPSFMGFGIYEAGGTAVLTAFGIDKVQSLVAMLSVHVWSQLFDYLIGGACLLLFVFLFKSVKSKSAEEIPVVSKLNQLIKLSLVGLVFLFGAGLLAKEYRATTKMGAVSAPKVGVDVSADFKDRIDATSQELVGINGFVVWSSNRFGNHDILKMELPSREITQLTSHPNTEFFSRVSPDGTHVVFARAHEEWVSQRNVMAWDVYVVNIQSGKEKLVAKNASFPNWVDNNSVSYLHKGVKVVVRDLSWLGKSKVVYESGRGNKMPLGAQVSTPEYNSLTGQTAFTGRQSQIGMNTGSWGTAIFNQDNTHKGLYNGCQLSFSSDNLYMYQVAFGGDYDKKGNRFMKVDIENGATEELFDFNDDYSHIYFPKDSNNGRYMVFGGSRGNHEHDTADYELFLWDMTKPSDYATRLTFHSGNDNWPDVYIR